MEIHWHFVNLDNKPKNNNQKYISVGEEDMYFEDEDEYEYDTEASMNGDEEINTDDI